MSAVRSRPTPQRPVAHKLRVFFYVVCVYTLFHRLGETYTGFSNDVTRRLNEHNITETKGFTLRYRPWALIRTESYATKQEAMVREKFLKTGRGREEIKNYVAEYIGSSGAVSAAAEKD